MEDKVFKVIRPITCIHTLKSYKLHLSIISFIFGLVQRFIYRAFDLNNFKYKHI